MTINKLPDDDLIYVFDFYLAESSKVEAWHTLVHVCRRWRTIVFGSPRRLNLRIACTDKTSVNKLLDVWPALPIDISGKCETSTKHDNIKAALEHHDRVRQIQLNVPWPSYLADVFAALEVPFPVLADLHLLSTGNSDPIFPNPVKFLGGSTHLRSLSFTGIPVPGLPKLLLSFTDLVNLELDYVPISGFFSPEAMVTALSTLTRLETFHLEIESFSDRENRLSPLPTRAILPSLTVLRFECPSEYLEDFMLRIDAPILGYLDIALNCSYADQDIVLDIQQLLRFIGRIPKLHTPDKAHIRIDSDIHKLSINFSWPKQISRAVKLGIHCLDPGLRVPRLVQFCHSPFFPLPTLEYLYIGRGQISRQSQLDEVENNRWLEFLQPFTAVKNLYLTKEFSPEIAHTLQNPAGERAMVLPALENVFIEPESQPSGSVHEAIGQFAAARRLSGHPIVIYHWDGRQA